MTAIKAACVQGPRAAHDSGPRPARVIRVGVVHSAESTSAAGVAAYFARQSTRASTHLAADQSRCVRMLPDLVIPWGAPGVNRAGVHIEICGYAKWTREQWLARKRMLERSAYKMAGWCFRYDFPARWLTADELQRLRKGLPITGGLTTHAEASKAFPDIGSGHWDPGPNFPRGLFLSMVRGYLRELEQAWDNRPAPR